MNYSPNIFTYSNQQYTLFITLFTANVNSANDVQISLDVADVEEFIYEEKLNDLLVRGKVVFVDKYGAIDKMINQQYCYCNITFALNSKKADNEIGPGKFDNERKIIHDFIVTDIKTLERNTSIIKYEIDLISANWFKCAANISYSNYGKQPEPIFQIVKNCLINNNLNVDTESFDRVKAPIELNWISKQNDNIFSSLAYLFHKLYYFNNLKDDSIKFIMYDLLYDKYRLIDIKDKYTFIGSFNTTLSFFKTDTELLIQQEPTNLGSFKQTMPKQNVYSNMFEKHMYSYDLNYNNIYDVLTESKTLANFINMKFDNDTYVQKYMPMLKYPGMIHKRSGMYWENQFDIYNDSIDILEQNNSLLLNITGDILRQVGSINMINVDRGLENVTTDDKKELENLKKKYKAYEGMWIASKVKTIICPNTPSFRQQVALFRNFIPKDVSST